VQLGEKRGKNAGFIWWMWKSRPFSRLSAVTAEKICGVLLFWLANAHHQSWESNKMTAAWRVLEEKLARR
jgi:hypothetical protein